MFYSSPVVGPSSSSSRGPATGLQTLRANDAIGYDLPDTIVDAVQPPVHLFYNIEAKQIITQHLPSLFFRQRADDNILHWWYGDVCAQDILLQLMKDWCQGGKQPLTVLAHNFQGYDSFSVIDSLHQLRFRLGQIRNWGKVLQLQCLSSSVRFIVSMSLFLVKLANFLETFGLVELKMGYFSHLFNHQEYFDHQEYVAPLPDQYYHILDGMSFDDRDDFRRWHDQLTNEGYVFDFRKELLDYYKSDVLLLKQECLTFTQEFEAKAGCEPFAEMTLLLVIATCAPAASSPTPYPVNLCSIAVIGVSPSRL